MAEQEYKGVARCPICLDSEADSIWVGLPCGHVLHQVCWLQSREHKAQCPKCKAPTARHGSKADGLRLYLDNEMDVPLAAVSTGGSQDAHQHVRRHYEQRLKSKEKELDGARERMASLELQYAALVDSTTKQTEEYQHAKSKLKTYKAEAKLKLAELEEQLTRACEDGLRLQTQLVQAKKDNELLMNELAVVRRELDRAANKAAHLERNAVARKLTSNHMLSETEIKKLCGVSTGQLVDLEVVIAALQERNKQYEELRQNLGQQEEQQQQVQLQHEQQLCNLRRAAADKIRQRERERDEARGRVNDLEYELGDLRSQLTLQQDQLLGGVGAVTAADGEDDDDDGDALDLGQQQQQQLSQKQQAFKHLLSQPNKEVAQPVSKVDGQHRQQHRQQRQEGWGPLDGLFHATAAVQLDARSGPGPGVQRDVSQGLDAASTGAVPVKAGSAVGLGTAAQLHEPVIVLDGCDGNEQGDWQCTVPSTRPVASAEGGVGVQGLGQAGRQGGVQPAQGGGHVKAGGPRQADVMMRSSAGGTGGVREPTTKRPHAHQDENQAWHHQKRPAVLSRPPGPTDAASESFLGKATALGGVRRRLGDVPLRQIQPQNMQPTFCSLDNPSVRGAAASLKTGLKPRPGASTGKAGAKTQAKISQFIQSK